MPKPGKSAVAPTAAAEHHSGNQQRWWNHSHVQSVLLPATVACNRGCCEYVGSPLPLSYNCHQQNRPELSQPDGTSAWPAVALAGGSKTSGILAPQLVTTGITGFYNMNCCCCRRHMSCATLVHPMGLASARPTPTHSVLGFYLPVRYNFHTDTSILIGRVGRQEGP